MDTVKDAPSGGGSIWMALRIDNLNSLDGIVCLRSCGSSTMHAKILIQVSGG